MPLSSLLRHNRLREIFTTLVNRSLGNCGRWGGGGGAVSAGGLTWAEAGVTPMESYVITNFRNCKLHRVDVSQRITFR